jgi:hypothetical protein
LILYHWTHILMSLWILMIFFSWQDRFHKQLNSIKSETYSLYICLSFDNLTKWLCDCERSIAWQAIAKANIFAQYEWYHHASPDYQI